MAFNLMTFFGAGSSATVDAVKAANEAVTNKIMNKIWDYGGSLAKSFSTVSKASTRVLSIINFIATHLGAILLAFLTIWLLKFIKPLFS